LWVLFGFCSVAATKIRGAGLAASIPAVIRGNARTARPPRSTRHALISRAAWCVFLSKRTEADFQAWRDQRDWTAEKYRRFDRGERMQPFVKVAETPHRNLKFNLMVSADCEPTSASRASALYTGNQPSR
jgi:hypothetical protein